MAHLRARHSDAESLEPFDLPNLSDLLRRCTRCSHICAGHNGVRHHQSKNPTCVALTDVPPPLQSRSSYFDRRIPSTEPSPFDDDALLSLFSAGLFNVHRTWSDKLHPVSSRLLTIIVENRASTAPLASLAFTLLPGVVGAYHQYRKKPVSLLLNYFIANVSTTDDVQFSNMVLDSARELAPILAAKRELGRDLASGPSRPNATRLRLRIERLRRERRDGPAMQTVEGLQNLLDQELLREVDIEHLPTHYDVATVRSTLATLCPPASEADELSEAHLLAISQAQPLEVTSGQVLRALEKLPDGAAAGASGWTFGAMKAIFLRNSSTTGEQTGELLAQFCTLMLSGKLVSRIWLRSRSVFVPKKDNTPRPLGIGDAWYRLVGRVSLTSIGKRVGGSLRPHQLGVAIKNGCEIGGRTAQMAFDAGENLVVAPLDNENAFNTMPRGSICTGLVTYAPELLAFFSYAYREPSPLFFQGEWVADMATGCKQGDNFGSLFYAVGFQHHLIKIHEAIQRHIEGFPEGCSPVGGGGGYGLHRRHHNLC